MKSISTFAREQGLLVDLDLLESCVELFRQEMDRGLLGGDSSLPMLATYIQPGQRSGGDRRVIAIDAGGTNLRIALVFFPEGGEPQVEHFEKYPMPGTREELTADAFFDRLAEYLEPVAPRAEQIGFCFSFPAEIRPDLDARILYFDKEVRVRGAENRLLGEGLIAALKNRGLDRGHRVAVINDTVASLLAATARPGEAAWGSFVGFILGTGINCCYLEQNSRIRKDETLRHRDGQSVVNMESGCLDKLDLGPVDRAFIAGTQMPQRKIMEKLTSGAYQSGLFLGYLRAAAQEGCLSPEARARVGELRDLSGLEIDLFCDAPLGGGTLAGLCAGEADAVALYQLADAFFDRVALLAAANLIGVLDRLGDAARNPCRPVCISAEGTTFYKARLLRPRLDYFLESGGRRRMNLWHRFVQVDNATILGTAAAGLLAGADH